jgi:glycosyltransferase involved in cell wall biosynthesis
MDTVKNIAVVGNYLPRMCGIATFTTDLVEALSSKRPDIHCWTVAMNDRPEGYRYPPQVRFEINQNMAADYHLAGKYLNINQVDIVSLQHEYGIFGGEAGSYILQLLRNLRMPVVTTFHTVLREPNAEQKGTLKEIAALSSHVVVMSQHGADFLTDIYSVPEEKISLIHHGIPDMPFVDPNFYKDQFDVEGKKVILTFGLLSQDKGIQYMIEALPEIVKKHPETVYIVLGATHPHVKKNQGEEYRQGLERLACKLGVEENILFFNRFVEFKELCKFLGATDIYVTPYLVETQIVSGTLAYAMGVGKATISTPYWYAQELIGNDRGILCPFKDPASLAAAVNRLLDDEVQRNSIRKRAYTFSRSHVWSQVAVDYLTLFNEVKSQRACKPYSASRPSTLKSEKLSLPDIKLDHLLSLTDDTGVLQHATFSIPDRNHGYCLDDNVRALIVSVTAHDLLPAADILVTLQNRYLAFIAHAYNEATGWFRNFMSYDRCWLEDKGSQDSQGRTIWALGVCCALSKDEGCIALSTQFFHKGIGAIEKMHHPRALAFSLVGIHAYLTRFSGDSEVKRIREVAAEQLFTNFSGSTTAEWPWFDELVTYANAKIPQALLLSGQWMQRNDMLTKGYELLDWLIGIQVREDHFSPIGNNGWYRRYKEITRFDQQPIEAQAMMETCLLASRMSGTEKYYKTAELTLNWFLGQNDLGQPLYVYKTGGCKDGLTPDGPNLNQGAESTLAWLLSLIAMHGYVAEQKKFYYVDPVEK